MFGSGIGGLQTTYDASVLLHEKGPRRLSPFIITGMLINLTSGQISIPRAKSFSRYSLRDRRACYW